MKCPFFPFAVISVAYAFYILLVSAPLRVGAAHAPFQHITSAAPLSFRCLSLSLVLKVWLIFQFFFFLRCCGKRLLLFSCICFSELLNALFKEEAQPRRDTGIGDSNLK